MQYRGYSKPVFVTIEKIYIFLSKRLKWIFLYRKRDDETYQLVGYQTVRATEAATSFRDPRGCFRRDCWKRDRVQWDVEMQIDSAECFQISSYWRDSGLVDSSTTLGFGGFHRSAHSSPCSTHEGVSISPSLQELGRWGRCCWCWGTWGTRGFRFLYRRRRAAPCRRDPVPPLSAVSGCSWRRSNCRKRCVVTNSSIEFRNQSVIWWPEERTRRRWVMQRSWMWGKVMLPPPWQFSSPFSREMNVFLHQLLKIEINRFII